MTLRLAMIAAQARGMRLRPHAERDDWAWVSCAACGPERGEFEVVVARYVDHPFGCHHCAEARGQVWRRLSEACRPLDALPARAGE